VQGVRYWFTWRIEKIRSHLIGDECFFNSPGESRGCAMYVQTLAGSRFNISDAFCIGKDFILQQSCVTCTFADAEVFI
jgi:hypothetical protein